MHRYNLPAVMNCQQPKGLFRHQPATYIEDLYRTRYSHA